MSPLHLPRSVRKTDRHDKTEILLKVALKRHKITVRRSLTVARAIPTL